MNDETKKTLNGSGAPLNLRWWILMIGQLIVFVIWLTTMGNNVDNLLKWKDAVTEAGILPQAQIEFSAVKVKIDALKESLNLIRQDLAYIKRQRHTDLENYGPQSGPRQNGG